MSGRLDPVDQTTRRWRSADRIIAHARHLSADHDLDPRFVERMESPALHGDTDEFLAAVRELLDEMGLD